MIVLDTNVVSELAKSPERIAPSVLDWFRRLEPETIFITTVALAELWDGIEMLPEGKRRRELAITVEAVVKEVFADRVLPFDAAAARAFASVCRERRAIKEPVKPVDMMMAAIASSHGMLVATRDFKDFLGCGVPLIDPWEPAP